MTLLEIARELDPTAPWHLLGYPWGPEQRLLGFDGLRFLRAILSARQLVERRGGRLSAPILDGGYFRLHRPRSRSWRRAY